MSITINQFFTVKRAKAKRTKISKQVSCGVEMIGVTPVVTSPITKSNRKIGVVTAVAELEIPPAPISRKPAAEWFPVQIGGREIKRGKVETPDGTVIVTIGQVGGCIGEFDGRACTHYSLFREGYIYEYEAGLVSTEDAEKMARTFAGIGYRVWLGAVERQ